MFIEKNIPIPATTNSGKSGRPPKYPFRNMDIGDSMLVDGKSSRTCDCPAYNSAKQLQRKTTMKFSARAEGNDKVRIWRIA